MTRDAIVKELRNAPFIRITVSFIIGIILTNYLNPSLCFLTVITLFLTLVLLSLYSVKVTAIYSIKFLWGIILFFTIISLSVTNTYIYSENKTPPDNIYESQSFLIRLNSNTFTKNGYSKIEGVILNFKDDSIIRHCKYACIVSFKEKSLSQNIEVGDILYVQSVCKAFEPPRNPDEFNYKNYMAQKGVYCNFRITDADFIKAGHENTLWVSICKLQQKLLNKFKNNHLDKRENAVISSLVLGYTADIDNEVVQAYSVTGTMHILSVSGLHVGIVYLFLGFLLSFIKNNKYLIILKTVLIITGIWLYSLIAGFAPPVVRSAVMFTFLAAGTPLNKVSNPLNILAASALFTLLFNPLQVYDVGFQLSYLAVLGILLFYDTIYHHYTFKTWLADQVWKLVSVSLAAQVFTFPITMFYFHQFSNYFIITNLLIVPLSGFILYMGLTFLIIDFIPYLNTIIATILNYLVKWMNETVLFIEKIPGASISDIYISTPTLFLLFAFIITAVLFLKFRNVHHLFYALMILLCIFSIRLYETIQATHQQKLIVYNIKGQTAIDLVSGTKHVLITSPDKEEMILRKTKNYCLRLGLSDAVKISTDTIINKMRFFTNFTPAQIVEINRQVIVYARDKMPEQTSLTTNFKTKYLIFNKITATESKKWIKLLNPENVIFDSSVKQNYCPEDFKKCYFIQDREAFIADL